MKDAELLIAYQIYPGHNDMPLTTAQVDREWMDRTDGRFAYRCLPLAIANQAGWLIPCPAGFSAWWDGGNFKPSVHLTFDPPPGAPAAAASTPPPTVPHDSRISSHFGSGIITFSLPYLFRTPRGVNLWVKGPTNLLKDGIQPLEGIVETDWLPATFTMNWRLTRTHHVIHFERGEPICMIVPVARGLAEGLAPVYLPLNANPELARDYHEWEKSRSTFNADLEAQRPEAVKRGWQRDYVKGVMSTGALFEEHQTKIDLREFTPAEGDQDPPAALTGPQT